jgi:deoxyribodipyrimidine photo-lyase
MVANRRVRFNLGLQRAVEWAQHLGLPLQILEALRADYPWASSRMHRFLLDGMHDNRELLGSARVGYHPYVESSIGAGKGLLARLADDAAVVVTDDFPAFFLRRMVNAAAQRVAVRMETVDANGVLPLMLAGRAYQRAFDFRRFMQRTLPGLFAERPQADPLLSTRLPPCPPLAPDILQRWPAANDHILARQGPALHMLPIDHTVRPVATPGGWRAARETVGAFVRERMPAYASPGRERALSISSGLSPYLHFGHISAWEVFSLVAAAEGWQPEHVAGEAGGAREGWWGMSPGAEAFLDQLIVWRELGFNTATFMPDFDTYPSLPDWARATLDAHRHDAREYVYTMEAFETGRTHDPLWNAAQQQLRQEGMLPNLLRMLWGKKILEWSATPEAALETMLRLNDRYALDGRDPNSCSDVFWVLGRYDRAWGPERPVLGKVRYMSSERMLRKIPQAYVSRYVGSA